MFSTKPSQHGYGVGLMGDAGGCFDNSTKYLTSSPVCISRMSFFRPFWTSSPVVVCCVSLSRGSSPPSPGAWVCPCRSPTTVCPGTATGRPRAASCAWCTMGTTRCASAPPRWRATAPGRNPATSTFRTPVSAAAAAVSQHLKTVAVLDRVGFHKPRVMGWARLCTL